MVTTHSQYMQWMLPAMLTQHLLPGTLLLAVVPDTTIDSAIDGLNNGVSVMAVLTPTDSMTFTFSGTDNNPSSELTFTCELTGPSPLPADTDCDPTGTTFSPLLDGCVHILRICSGCCQQR